MIEIFSTCPPSLGTAGAEYVRRVADVARWSEEAGCRGILVYSDNSLVDPWLLSHVIVQHTGRLRPLVAVQPDWDEERIDQRTQLGIPIRLPVHARAPGAFVGAYIEEKGTIQARGQSERLAAPR